MNYEKIFIPLNKEEYKTYSRQILVKNINIQGQQRLKHAKILFIGAGGLAAGALLYLAGAGIGNIGIVDEDHVELSNLHRQIIYNRQDIETYKAVAAYKHLKDLNPSCNIKLYLEEFNKNNASQIVHNYDIIIDSTDNFSTRYLLSDICYQFHKIHIYGGVASLEGQVSVFNYKGGPSYKDLYPFITSEHSNSCIERGVLGVLPGIIGLIQATEALKIIIGVGKILSGEMLIYNSLDLSFKKIKLRNTNSYREKEISDKNPTKPLLHNYSLSFQKFREFNKKNHKLIYLIDLRSPLEYQIRHIINAINIPLERLTDKSNLMRIKSLSQHKYIIIYCNSYMRSIIASKLLREANILHWILNIK